MRGSGLNDVGMTVLRIIVSLETNATGVRHDCTLVDSRQSGDMRVSAEDGAREHAKSGSQFAPADNSHKPERYVFEQILAVV